MIKKLKREYRKFRERQLEQSYQRKLQEEKATYDSWIKIRESEEASCVKEGTTKEEEKDYYLFVTDPEGISASALKEIESIFTKEKQAVVIYGDEDQINRESLVRSNPLLKPDYSPDTLLSYFYFGNLLAVKKEAVLPFMKTKPAQGQWLITISSGNRKEFYEMVLRLCYSLKKENIYHIKKILYHFENYRPWGFEADYMDLKHKIFSERKKKESAPVSIIIPSKDNPKVLERCLRSIRQLTEKAEYEIIVVDNGSNEKNRQFILKLQEELDFSYFYHSMEFNFSRMCNLGASRASYPYLLFLNDDCEVRTPLWLYEMVRQASVEETGAVGMKLFYPESRMIQHCGIYGLAMGPVHKLQFQQDDQVYYDRRNRDIRNVLAVTGACLMMRKDVFLQMKGFDEKLQVAFNDVDLCYRIYEAGYHNVVINTHHLYHHESLSRGSDDSEEKRERFLTEKLRLYEKHQVLWWKDPYYHPWFTEDILDVNYSFAYQYQAKTTYEAIEQPQQKIPEKLREDSCVAVTLEHCGRKKDWFLKERVIDGLKNENTGREEFYFQGTVVVLGSDNACYEKYLVLWEEEKEIFYQVLLPSCYRPDVEKNLRDQKNVGLSGFSLLLDRKKAVPGKYRVCAMVKDRISGQYIIRKTANHLWHLQ